ncbi:helix-turn-helix domain-containing protein [Blastococcus sp. CT_GayMR19]|uniref:helix-turn-helix domain-containing protein n=1 Tax=Blastococcus sp. CT_GayMR19 TaxID=2559608 RepID=UPI001FD76E3D|nr:helix-turn-helix domain-containing protein [Blastococcus sp. CT_GayMR19]
MDDHPEGPPSVPGTLADPDLDTRTAAPRLRASWRRSEQYGVPHDEVLPVFTGSVDTGSLLAECASQVLTGLQSTIANEPVSLMVADSDGLVLIRLCTDPGIRSSLDRVHLAPGFSYSERNAGTNGLGLSLADRAPSLVRAADHYCSELRGYTCAAAPVLDPVSGELAGSINLTTWSDSSSELLLALAQAAAGATTGLMLVRSTGRAIRPAPRGEVFHVVGGHLSPATGDPCGSTVWRAAVGDAAAATAAGRVLAVVGEPGAGKATLAALARRRHAARQRILHARAPEAPDVAAWLELWTPGLRSADACIIVSGIERLPAWAAEDLVRTLDAVRSPDRPQPFVLTAAGFTAIPEQLARLVDTVVEAPPLRHRADDVLPLAHHVAREERHRDLSFTPRAARALTSYHWPENVRQLRRIVRDAASRADVIDVQHLAPEVLDGGRRTLTRLERLERDEIIRCLTEPHTTIKHVAEDLGIGRATLYRKIAQYDITVPSRSASAPA